MYPDKEIEQRKYKQVLKRWKSDREMTRLRLEPTVSERRWIIDALRRQVKWSPFFAAYVTLLLTGQFSSDVGRLLAELLALFVVGWFTWIVSLLGLLAYHVVSARLDERNDLR
jgi:hypothetical protein